MKKCPKAPKGWQNGASVKDLREGILVQCLHEGGFT
jgi:hypothetical protein